MGAKFPVVHEFFCGMERSRENAVLIRIAREIYCHRAQSKRRGGEE